jgi:hypothetical protein
MSLHRIIAEIKMLEAKLSLIGSTVFVGYQVGDETDKTIEFKTNARSSYDKLVSNYKNLATLKAARNKANSETKVTIAGNVMTIDEALSAKATLPYKQSLIATLTAQFTQAQRQVDASVTQIEAKIAQQIATMFTGTRKATDEEIAVIRAAAERNQKGMAVIANGLKENLEALKAEVEAFTLEVDFVLSEANATTKVDVTLV